MAELRFRSAAESAEDIPLLKLDPPRVFMMCGLQGSGKSTIARLIASKIASLHLRTDAIRKQLFATPTYTAAESDLVYQHLLNMASEGINSGESVILDGTHSYAANREGTISWFKERGVTVVTVYVHAPEELTLDRLDNRVDDISDATAAVYLAAKQKFQVPEAPEITIYNRGNIQILEIELEQHLIRELFPQES